MSEPSTNILLQLLHDSGINAAFYREQDEKARAALRMIREAVEEMFGPIADMPSEDSGVLGLGGHSVVDLLTCLIAQGKCGGHVICCVTQPHIAVARWQLSRPRRVQSLIRQTGRTSLWMRR